MVQEEDAGVQDEETDQKQVLETHPPGSREQRNNFGITNRSRLCYLPDRKQVVFSQFTRILVYRSLVTPSRVVLKEIFTV